MGKVALSIDLESLSVVQEENADRLSAIEIDAVNSVLDLLGGYAGKATFFVVPTHFEGTDLVKRIHDAGHEVASHSLTHRSLDGLGPGEVERELGESRDRLEEITGEPPTGFRAPRFKRPEGFFDVLRDAGYTYDSSMVPSLRIPGWYGGDDCGLEPFQMENGLTEVPVSVSPWHRMPISGFWSRLLGKRQALAAVDRLVKDGVTPVLYFHPFEFADLSDIPGTPLRRRFRGGEYARSLLEDVLERHGSLRVDSMWG